MERAATENIHSNAFNFMSFLTAGVDARTGVYTCSLSLSQLQGNDLMGPAVPLVLAFNPLQTRDVGFGQGWSLQKSSYDPRVRRLTLSTGDTYEANKTATAFYITDQKLKSFNVTVDTGDTLRVEHKSGLVEVLSNPDGGYEEWLPTTLHTAEGRTLKLEYLRHPTLRIIYLSEVSDASQTLLKIEPRTTAVAYTTLTMWPNDADKKLVVRMHFFNSEVSRVELVLKDSLPSWRISMTTVFGMRVISEMEPPSGGKDFLTYSATGLALPVGAPLPFLPCVAKHIHAPGQGQPVVTRVYEYTSNNYLGWGAVSWSAQGDNLYKVLQPYEYSSQEIETVGSGGNTQVLRRTTRRYNRFHLLVGEEVRQGTKVQIKNISYYDEPGKHFTDQPAQLQLPKSSEVIYRDGISERIEVTLTEFDEYGNPTKTTMPSGAIETTVYYPVAGEGALCPPDPLGFVRSVKLKTLTPAPGYAAAPTLSTAYRYSLLKSLRTNGKDFLVLDKEELFEGADLRSVNDKVYVNDTTSPSLHGRLKTDTLTLNGKTTVTGFTYVADDKLLRTTTLLTGYDNTTAQSVEMLDILTGQQVEVRGNDGVVIYSVYDSLGRLVSETVAPGTTQAATKTYEYALAETDGDVIESVVKDASGALTVTRFDGLGREVLITVQDIDVSPQPPTPLMREVYSALYDELGQLVKEVHTDWIDGVAKPLVTTHAYDEWANPSQTTGPDGVTSYSVIDPIKRTQSQRVENAGKVVVTSNVLEKPDKEERFDKSDVLEGTTSYVYDGLGRCILQTDAENRATAFTYDYAGRLLTTTLPDLTVITKAYAPHSTEDLPVSVKVTSALKGKGKGKGKGKAEFPLDYLAGQQTYDGLSRLTSVTVADRVQTYTYTAGQNQPTTQKTPNGAIINFEYQPELNNQLVRRTVASSPEASASYTYDDVHAQLVQASTPNDDLYGQRLTYFPSGLLKQEDWNGGTPPYKATYKYSFAGLPTSYTDVFGQEQKTAYDAAGRVLQVTNGEVQADFSYTPLGQLMKTVTQVTTSSPVRSLTTALEYDDFGRETLRTFTVSGEAQPQVLKQRFDRTDKLLQRTLSAGSTVLRDETYAYDPRGRLVLYNCTGSEAPVDAAGKTLVSQAFTFDALDNIRTLATVFVAGTATATNTATYAFDYADKTQLSSVSHTHPDYAAQNVTLHYNADGHQIDDEQGRVLDYDAIGRLVSVSSVEVAS